MPDWIRRISPLLVFSLVLLTQSGFCATEIAEAEYAAISDQWALVDSQPPLMQLQTAEKLHKQSASDESLLLKAVALSRLSRLDEAESLLQALSTEQPAWIEPPNNLGVIYASQGKWHQAAEVLQQALNTNKNSAVTYANIRAIYDYRAASAYKNVLGDKTPISEPQLALQIRMPEKIRQHETVTDRPVTYSHDDVRKHVNNWLTAWQNGQVENYLAAYSDSFVPDEGLPLAEWKRNRRSRLQQSGKIQITYDFLEVYLNENQRKSVVVFEQHYASNHYKDKVLKEMSLIRKEGRWLIDSEKVLKSYESR